ncbi:MAG: hypothetical protein JXL80_04980, partial [Planctomycetes bacterium]|nr:hypothetical protein [Planctomycetota bacterium]
MKSDTPPEFRDALRHWGLAVDKGYSLEPLGGYGINSANFRVVAPGGEAAGHLKVIARPDATTGAKLEAWRRCGQAGVRVARLHPASHGRPAVECGGRLLAMFAWCDGQPFADRAAQREAAGRELARLEAALAAVG